MSVLLFCNWSHSSAIIGCLLDMSYISCYHTSCLHDLDFLQSAMELRVAVLSDSSMGPCSAIFTLNGYYRPFRENNRFLESIIDLDQFVLMHFNVLL